MWFLYYQRTFWLNHPHSWDDSTFCLLNSCLIILTWDIWNKFPSRESPLLELFTWVVELGSFLGSTSGFLSLIFKWLQLFQMSKYFVILFQAHCGLLKCRILICCCMLPISSSGVFLVNLSLPISIYLMLTEWKPSCVETTQVVFSFKQQASIFFFYDDDDDIIIIIIMMWWLGYWFDKLDALLHRKVELVAEEAGSLKESLDRYFARNQRRMKEAQERAELLGRAVCFLLIV